LGKLQSAKSLMVIVQTIYPSPTVSGKSAHPAIRSDK